MGKTHNKSCRQNTQIIIIMIIFAEKWDLKKKIVIDLLIVPVFQKQNFKI